MSVNTAYLNVNGDVFFDASGSSTASLQAVNVNVANLTANQVTASNLDFNNLNVTGEFNVTGVNDYEGSLKAGDLISYNLICFMDTSGIDYYYSVLNSLTGGLITPAQYDVNVYEIIYWGIDTRSNNLTRMSGTLIVPVTSVSSVIVSCKHATITEIAQPFTLWNLLLAFSINNIPFYGGGDEAPVDVASLSLAGTGYTTITADNPGFGVSLGAYNYLNPGGEAWSQYNALLSTKDLMALKPELFPGFDTSITPIPVIETGYSLGGLVTLQIAQLIQNDPTNNLKVINLIPGAPVNVAADFYKTSYNPELPMPWSFLNLTLMMANGNSLYQNNFLLPNIYTDVLPILNQFYLNTYTKQYNQTGNVKNATYNSVVNYGDVSSNLWPNPDASGGYVYGSTCSNVPVVKQYIRDFNQAVFYTNNFIDYSDVSGVPINVFYSQQDELACYKPNNPVLEFGDASNDMIAPYLKAFMTDTSFVNVAGVVQGPPSNALGRALGSGPGQFVENLGIVLNSGTLATEVGNAVTQLIYSELGAAGSSNNSYDTLGLGGLGHEGFYNIFYLIVNTYLTNRPK